MIPEFMTMIGKVKPTGDRYILDVCPFCGGSNTFEFIGKCGLWGCRKCSGGKQYQFKHLKALLVQTESFSEVGKRLPEPLKPDGLINISGFADKRNGHRISTGFNRLDRVLGGFADGAMTVITGATGNGKSTLLGQIALNAIEDGEKVCFYSGELSTALFQEWLFAQAAGARYLIPVTDRFGETEFLIESEAEKHVRQWLKDKLILYDNEVTQDIKHNDILARFEEARQYYGCTLFIADNLMSASFLEPTSEDAWHKEANFAQALLNFTKYNKVHSILVAHPKKAGTGENIGDIAGLSKITSIASNVCGIMKIEDEQEQIKEGGDSQLTVIKNRERGKTGKITMNFDVKTKRFLPTKGGYTEKYSWEELW